MFNKVLKYLFVAVLAAVATVVAAATVGATLASLGLAVLAVTTSSLVAAVAVATSSVTTVHFGHFLYSYVRFFFKKLERE
jgi:membrane protein implicated in regulation of membrane protease activity